VCVCGVCIGQSNSPSAMYTENTRFRDALITITLRRRVRVLIDIILRE